MTSTPGNAVDVIICGGGASGCVVDSRLAAARPDLQIILIEQGPSTLDDVRASRPLDGLLRVFEQPPEIKYYPSIPLPQINGRSPIVPSANILGGGGSVNFMMYNNAAASDFDDWGVDGWRFKDLEPLAQRAERWIPGNGGGKQGGTKFQHGQDGPMEFTFGSVDTSDLASTYFDACKTVKDLPVVDDLFEFHTSHGCGYLGHRTSAAHAYLFHGPLENTQANNIRLLSKTRVTRILWEGQRATGVEVEGQTILGRKGVVLCAGAFGSPGILERSGIGSPEYLEKAGISVRIALDGVGERYQDHELILSSYRVTEATGTYDRYIQGDREKINEEWIRSGTGPASTNGIDYGYKLRPSQNDLKSLGDNFAKHWQAIDQPDKSLFTGTFIRYYLGGPPFPTYPCISLGAISWYPKGLGSVHIKTSYPEDLPIFDSGLLEDDMDVEVQAWGYKINREIARRLPFYLGEHEESHPNFPPGSAAGLANLDHPMDAGSITDLVYSEEDDDAIREWVRAQCDTCYHSMGTCAMKSREQGGVVGPDLRVHGTEGLWVAGFIGSNTTTTALIIGEKAAEILLQSI